ncbi:hypothetical protein MUK42_27046 [Musa troglodytarum]|uniref:Uncharacterized protein n=1 Tax=Musa troglodytarum TaxID=320322 RepID=A0A9E7FPL5_9LILI|nr:hypothetical protein MUK42_27046 [Musa troglodytarum]
MRILMMLHRQLATTLVESFAVTYSIQVRRRKEKEGEGGDVRSRKVASDKRLLEAALFCFRLLHASEFGMNTLSISMSDTYFSCAFPHHSCVLPRMMLTNGDELAPPSPNASRPMPSSSALSASMTPNALAKLLSFLAISPSGDLNYAYIVLTQM